MSGTRGERGRARGSRPHRSTPPRSLGQQPRYLPFSRGFQSYRGVPYSVDMGWSALSNAPQQPLLPLYDNAEIIEAPVDFATLTDGYIAHATRFIDAHGTGGANASNPFFLYAAFNHVHTPMFASPRFNGSSPRGQYGDGVAELDDAVGQIMARVRGDPALATNTLVFFGSDNGPWLVRGLQGGSAGLFYEGKGSTWEGGMRSPGIFWWPGVIPPASTARVVASHVDLLPTFAAAAGAALPHAVLDGVDLMPVLRAPTNAAAVRDYYFYWRGEDQTLPNATVRSGLWAARDARSGLKAHFVTKSAYGNDLPVFHDPPLLFNLDWDPSELFPLDPAAFAPQLAALVAAAVAHHAQVSTGVPDQCLGSVAGTCADPNCTWCPALPNCTLTPRAWGYAYPDRPGTPPPSDRRVPYDP